jgi:hypothetical protein
VSGLGDCPEISVQELKDSGLLQEVNRRFFHPLGLALAIQMPTGNGAVGRLMVIDGRDDPEGILFAVGDLAAKAEAVRAEWDRREPARRAALGYMVQPVLGSHEEAG